MKELWLIRHAESIANIGEVTSSPQDVPLTVKGKRQADQLARKIKRLPDLVFISPYLRAEQTARPFLDRNPGLIAEQALVQEFTYLSRLRCRDTDGRTRKPWVDEYWQRSDPFYTDGEGCESFEKFVRRCAAFRKQIAERKFGFAIVFTHGQFIKCLMWQTLMSIDRITGNAMRSFHSFMASISIANAAVIGVTIDRSGQFYFGESDPIGIDNHARTENNSKSLR